MQMESCGAYLKGAREEKKISLAEITRATKIRRAILEAIERDHAETLLPEVVVKGFVETYARHVGVDPEEALSRYSQRQGGSETAETEGTRLEEKQEVLKRYIVSGATLFIILFGILFLFLVGGPKEEGKERAITEARTEQEVIPPSEQLQPPSSTPSVKETPPLWSPQAAVKEHVVTEESSPVREHALVITASERTWVQIQEGTALPFDVVLYPGESYSRTSPHQLAILIGNAGGVQVTFDGVGLGMLGGVGEVVRLTLPSPDEG